MKGIKPNSSTANAKQAAGLRAVVQEAPKAPPLLLFAMSWVGRALGPVPWASPSGSGAGQRGLGGIPCEKLPRHISAYPLLLVRFAFRLVNC